MILVVNANCSCISFEYSAIPSAGKLWGSWAILDLQLRSFEFENLALATVRLNLTVNANGSYIVYSSIFLLGILYAALELWSFGVVQLRSFELQN